MSFRAVVLPLCCALLISCAELLPPAPAVAPSYAVTIDAIAAPQQPTGKFYALMPWDDSVSPYSLQFQEFAGYVHSILRQAGYTRVESPAEADVLLFLYYNISDPSTVAQTFDVPEYGVTGYTATSRPAGGYVVGGGTRRIVTGSSTNTTVTPKYGVTGTRQETTYVTKYVRGFMVAAYDRRESDKRQAPVEVWRTIALSEGGSGDLRAAMPALVVAASRYFGTNPGQRVSGYIAVDDPAVLSLKANPN
jgi:hypothetical protein